MQRTHRDLIKQALARVERLRRARGLTIIELADGAGLQDRVVYRWRSGRVEPRLSSLDAVAGVLGVSLDDLLSPRGRAKG